MGSLIVAPTAELAPDLLAELRRLCDGAFGKFDDADWEHALGGQHAVLLEDARPVAHAAVVPRTLWVGDRRFETGYVEAVATDAARQGSGLGTQVMQALDGVIREVYELGALSTGSHGFYERLGWDRWQGPTYVRDGEDTERTEEEDDGVMVLRFGRSADVVLTDPIAVPSRRGDDW